MQDKKSNIAYKHFLILVPFVIVYVGALIRIPYPQLNSVLKFSAFIYMVLYVLTHGKIPGKLFFFILVFLPFFLYGIVHSFNYLAAMEEGIRYLLPPVVLMYGYAIRHYFPLLIRFVIIFIIINFLVQIYNYIGWYRGKTLWYYHHIGKFYFAPMTLGMLRGTGFISNFALYGYVNLVAFVLIWKYYAGKYKRFLLLISLSGLILSLSYKTIGTAFIVFFLYYYKKIYKYILYLIVLIIVFFVWKREIGNKIVSDIRFRIQAYVTGSKSARADSYRVMFQRISKPDLFGSGIGTFGGPASIKYHSPYYKKFDYHWYDMSWANLKTTDTYPPHPFVELGLIGGLAYFLMLLSPLYRRKLPLSVLIIYFALFVDMLFSFSLNNLEYLMFSLVFIYPIYYWHEHLRNENKI